MASTPVQVILGTGTIGASSDALAKFNDPTTAQAFLDLFRSYRHTTIDTARGYSPHAPGSCESILAQTDLTTWATIDTKIRPHPDLKSFTVTRQIDESLAILSIPKINVEYIHAPHPATPLFETLAAIDAAHRAGKFARFGISNGTASPPVDVYLDTISRQFSSYLGYLFLTELQYSVAEVREIFALCKANDWVKPSVYQGQYNAVARGSENELIPLLREHGAALYAYSPGAGGLFSRTSKRGGMDNKIGKMHTKMYHKPALQTAATQIMDAAESLSPPTTGHALVLRWLLHHSTLDGARGDAIIIGASSLDQLRMNLDACAAGALDDKTAKMVEEMWEQVKGSAPRL